MRCRTLMRIATIILHYGNPKLTEKVYRALCETTSQSDIVESGKSSVFSKEEFSILSMSYAP